MAQQNQVHPQRPNYDSDLDVGGGNDTGTYASEEQEFLRLVIDVKDLLDNFEHLVLRGEYESIDVKTGQKSWVKYVKEQPIMNELGVREVLGRLAGHVTKAAKLSYKTEEEIYKDTFYFHLSLVELAAKRCDLWEADVETIKSITDAAIELVWNILSSSRNGFTAINMRSSYSRSDVTRSDSTQKEARSFLGIPLGRK